MRSNASPEADGVAARPLIAVVGVCASGKSTLVAALRERGYNARQVLQEHSYVPDMWQRFTGPDLLVYLDARPDTVRRRRNEPNWPIWLYVRQVTRLAHARAFCDLCIRTDDLTPEEVLAQVLRLLGRRGFITEERGP